LRRTPPQVLRHCGAKLRRALPPARGCSSAALPGPLAKPRANGKSHAPARCTAVKRQARLAGATITGARFIMDAHGSWRAGAAEA